MGIDAGGVVVRGVVGVAVIFAIVGLAVDPDGVGEDDDLPGSRVSGEEIGDLRLEPKPDVDGDVAGAEGGEIGWCEFVPVFAAAWGHEDGEGGVLGEQRTQEPGEGRDGDDSAEGSCGRRCDGVLSGGSACEQDADGCGKDDGQRREDGETAGAHGGTPSHAEPGPTRAGAF